MYFYTRPSGRSPAREFYDSRQKSMKNKLEGSMEALVKMGKGYVLPQRFCPLSGPGRPLWEFKEHDHRIYCNRQEHLNGSVQVILLAGWVKDKKGKSAEEANQIQAALSLNEERLREGARK